MPRLLPWAFALIACATPALPALADEFTDTMQGALDAYAKGDVDGARADVDYAGKLLTAMRAGALAKLFPEPLPGWTRQDADAAEASGFMGILGGGTTASASYSKGDQSVELTMIANSPMISGMAAMISNFAAMGEGPPIRINRTEFGKDGDDLQGVINGKVMLTVGGNASLEDKKAYISAMDFDAIGAF